MILGCTDLRIGVSGAKFDARADFEVRLPLARPKPTDNIEKPPEISEKKIQNFLSLTKRKRALEHTTPYAFGLFRAARFVVCALSFVLLLLLLLWRPLLHFERHSQKLDDVFSRQRPVKVVVKVVGTPSSDSMSSF